jgi:arsenite methyltransferase
VSGALAERVFAHKLAKVGFTGLVVRERRPFGLEDAARYPLFTTDLIELMRTLLPPERQAEVAVAVTVTARKPDSARP